MTQNHHLSDMLQVAVPLHVERLQEKGGPDEGDWQRLGPIGDALGYRGDVLLFGEGKKGEPAELFNDLAFALAVLSYVPGGVTLFGQNWTTVQSCEVES